MTADADTDDEFDNVERQLSDKPSNDGGKSQEGVEMMLVDHEPPTCWQRFRGEWRLKFFDLTEMDGSVIDERDSFAPVPFWRNLLLKLFIFLWATSVLVLDMLRTDPVSHYFIFFSNWALLFTTLYFLISLYNQFKGVPDQRPYEDTPTFFIRFAWGLYPTVATSEFASTILFWILQYKPGEAITYIMLMKHGILALVTILEGRFIDRVPVRIKHLLFPMLFSTLYIVWSVIFSYTNIGNPYSESNAIYPALDWKNSWEDAIITSVVFVLGITPFLFLNIWLLSIWSCPCHFDGTNRRHYYFEEKDKETASWWARIFGK